MSGNLSVLVPTALTTAMLTSSTAWEAPPATYAAGTTYAAGVFSGVAVGAGLFDIYQSLQASNLGHTPSASPTWWTKVGSAYQAYNPATSYASGDRVSDALTHRVYESLVPSNAGNLLSNALKWKDVGPTNPWAMFDGSTTTLTTALSPLTVVMAPGVFNAMYVGGVDAEQMTVTLKDAPGGTVIDTRTFTMENSAPGDYWEYFFDPFRPQTDSLMTDFIPYGAAEVTVTLTRPGGSVSCGVLAVGTLSTLGQTIKNGIRVRPKTYSKITTDDDGNTSIEVKATARDMSVSAIAPRGEFNWVLDQVTTLQAVPCLYAASDDAELTGLRCFGLGSGEFDPAHSTTHVLLTMEVKGITNGTN